MESRGLALLRAGLGRREAQKQHGCAAERHGRSAAKNFGRSKECGLNLNAAGGGVGKDEASAETERGAGGFHRVAARGDVVHEIGLSKCQGLARASKMVLLWRDGA